MQQNNIFQPTSYNRCITKIFGLFGSPSPCFQINDSKHPQPNFEKSPPYGGVQCGHVLYSCGKPSLFCSPLRIHWRLLTVLKTSNKSVWSNIFWYVIVCIFCKCIQYMIYWDKTQMVKKFPLDKITGIQKLLSYFFHKLQLISYIFNFQFLYGLKHKVHLSKNVCGIFHFQFCFVFIKVCISAQQNAWSLSF